MRLDLCNVSASRQSSDVEQNSRARLARHLQFVVRALLAGGTDLGEQATKSKLIARQPRPGWQPGIDPTLLEVLQLTCSPPGAHRTEEQMLASRARPLRQHRQALAMTTASSLLRSPMCRGGPTTARAAQTHCHPSRESRHKR